MRSHRRPPGASGAHTSRCDAASWLLAVACLSWAGCRRSDPADPRPWVEKLSDPQPRVRIRAVQELRKLRARDAAPGIGQLLQDPLVKEEAALALTTLGGPESVQPLVEAIDTTVGAGSDSATRAANRTNARIAEALGAIGYVEAGPPLLRLARSQEVSVRLAAVQALGEVRFRPAIPELSRIVDDETAPPLLTKKAVVALGQIGDAAALPGLIHALVIDRRGVTFLPEASWGLFQLREAAVDPLLAVAQDQDPAFLAWAHDTGRAPAGTYARVAVALGDLGDVRAVPVLLKLLRYQDPDPIPSTARLLSALVHQFAADALGRLRAREAASAILSLVTTRFPEDEEQDTSYGNALAWIGDSAFASDLLRKASSGAVRPRLALAQAAVTFGDASLRKDLARLASQEEKGKEKQCAAALSDLAAVSVERPSAPCTALARRFSALSAPLEAAAACAGQNAIACWSPRLSDKDPLVRARAAYELGRGRDAAAVPALVQAARDAELVPRTAAIRALEWLLPLPQAREELKAAAPRIAAQLAAEQGSAQFVKVNEDLRRLQARLGRI